MKKTATLILTFAVAAGILSTGCETTKKYSMKDRGSMFVNEKEQSENGAKIWAEFKREVPRARNRNYQCALFRVSSHLTAKYPNNKYIKWEFLVFESSIPNAFCLPGGKIAIYSGLFKYIKNDAELAMVVGHEIAHALCRHISERQETELFTNILGTAVEFTLEDQRYHKGYKTASHLGVTLPYSRKQEYEADYLGLKIATEAGYSPRAALKFLEQLGKIPKSEQEFEFFSTHPSASNRKKKLEESFYEFQSIYDKLGKAQAPPANTTLKTYSPNRKRNKKESIMERYVRERFLKDLNK